MILNVGQISTGFIEVPGQISINIYVQGCEKRCPGCHNPDLLSFDSGEKIDIVMMEKIVSRFPLSNWICWLGGDAVYQPEAFIEFNKFFKLKKYKIALYTGRLAKEIEYLLSDVDLVIDGEWNEKLGPVTKQGTNQRVYVKVENHNLFQEISFSEIRSYIK